MTWVNCDGDIHQKIAKRGFWFDMSMWNSLEKCSCGHVINTFIVDQIREWLYEENNWV